MRFIMKDSMTSTDQVNVLIAIQARSNSTRFPQKIYQLIGKKMVLQHVIDQAKSAKVYIERPSKKNIKCDIVVLHPEDDNQLISNFRNSGVLLLSGNEQDVLSRYVKAYKSLKPNYIVRLTSDCPLILDFVISKHINVAVLNQYDYVSNVEESCRQVADGLDCEILSSRAIEWLSEQDLTDEEKEHVTLSIRKRRPPELRQAFVSSKFDTSSFKLSLDTKEDLDNIRDHYHKREFKLGIAMKTFGRNNIFEI